MQRVPLAGWFAGLLLVSPSSAHDEALGATLAEEQRNVFYHVVDGGGGAGSGGEIYSDQVLAGPFDQALGIAFDDLARLWVWDKSGRVWFVAEDGTVGPEPMVDLSDEVGDWSAHGCLGFALDPQFSSNGFVYLFYVVDRHHLFNFGTPAYDPLVDDYFSPTQARLTRYQVFDPLLPGDEIEADPSSRTVLVGEQIGDGFPVCATSHGVGSVVFGEDGNLLLSFGDGYLLGSEATTCLSDGILHDAEAVQNYRAQLRDSHCGKVLRIDPVTGEGVATNPYFDPARPDAPLSRVWTSGVRQPYRMTVRPGTGSRMEPGTIYLGDVGALTWEELNVIPQGGTNLGWPIYEGMEPNTLWGVILTENPDAPNPLFGQMLPSGLCEKEFFDFQDLLHDETLAALDLPNPCDPSQQVPLEFQRMHLRPTLTWQHDFAVTYSKAFVGTEPVAELLGEPGTQVAGEPFPGNAAIGGVWYSGTDFPAIYQNSYFIGDYGEGWIKCLQFDQNDELVAVLPFTEEAGRPVAFATHPTEGGLYYINFEDDGGSTLRKITFVGDLEPVAVASVDAPYGPSPLTVQFSGDESTDFGQPLSYEWDFGDGSPLSTLPNPVHTYTNPGGAPTQIVATLTVTDSSNQTDTMLVPVSLDNTPPTARIVFPPNGAAYPSTDPINVPLQSFKQDNEHTDAELSCAWEVFLYHDNHNHPEPIDTDCETSTTIGPHTLPGDVEYYEVRLTVTDAAGLSTTDSNWLPREDDCNLNGYPDAQDIAQGWSLDVDLNGVPDECAADCDNDGSSDVFEILAALTPDCNGNGIPDDCDIDSGIVLDLDHDGTPDVCQALSATPPTISLAGGGAQTLTLDIGAEHAGDIYWVLGSTSGTTPGTAFGPVVLPLAVPDPYFDLTLTDLSAPFLVGTVGVLDPSGGAEAQITFAAGSPPAWAGIELTHAAIVVDITQLEVDGIRLVTNPMTLQLVP